MKTRLVAAVAFALGLTVPAISQDYAAAWSDMMSRMHMGMMFPASDNPDMDFAKGMVPHHQGAVDMANILLQYGSDPELRALAEQIIATQTEEIGFLQDWIARNGG